VETALAHEREWAHAGQVERIELLQSQIDTLRVERERLNRTARRPQLGQGTGALGRGCAGANRKGRTPVAKPDELTEILSPWTIQQLCEDEKAPIAWGKVAAVGGHVLLPWAGLGAFAYVIYALAA